MDVGLFKNEYGGYVECLRLTKWWKTLSDSEKGLAKDYIKRSYYPQPFDENLIDSSEFKVRKTKENAMDLLMIVGKKSVVEKQYELAEKSFIEATKRAKTKEQKREIYLKMIDMYYKQRSENSEAIERCAYYCKQDIALAKKLDNASTTSFKRLAIILEDQKKYDEAIRISELAISCGAEDGTKAGFVGRIEKLKQRKGIS